MALSTNPQYRLIAAPSNEPEAPRTELTPFAQVLRIAAYIPIVALFCFLIAGGTMESRLTYLLAFLVSFLNPIWGMYALALLGPLYLLDPGKTHLLAGLEVFVLGMAAGELRLLGRGIVGLDAAGRPCADYSLTRDERPVSWGHWPHFLMGLILLLSASSLVGLQLVFFQERPFEPTGSRWLNIALQTFYGTGTSPEWVIKSFWNWGSGILLAVIVARRANPLVMARWLKLAGLSLFVACCFSLLDWLGWLSLTDIRRANTDPLHAGRLQGTAGHAGWYGQWVVLMWPGLLLWWSRGRNKRNLVLAAALSVVGLCLVLTAARAAWLGAGAALLAGMAYLVYTYPETRRYIPWAIGGAILVAIIGIVAGGDTLANRLIHLFRAQDRANYYFSGLYFLRDHPFGLGLGTHFLFYEWTFTPFYRWFQPDHVTAHSLWLHTLIENGPFLPALLLGGIYGVAREVRKSWHRFDAHTRTLMIATCLGLLGLVAVSFAQYIVYIRIVELSAWIGFGGIVGLCRKKRCRVEEEVHSWGGQRLLMACGLAAALMASVNASRVYTDQMPRHYDMQQDATLSFWTGAEWSTPVNREVDRINFSLHRKALPAEGTIHWPDGTEQDFRLGPEETRTFEFTREAAENDWKRRQPILRIDVAPLFTPAEYLEGNEDRRQLGVYVSGLRLESERLREFEKERAD